MKQNAKPLLLYRALVVKINLCLILITTLWSMFEILQKGEMTRPRLHSCAWYEEGGRRRLGFNSAGSSFTASCIPLPLQPHAPLLSQTQAPSLCHPFLHSLCFCLTTWEGDSYPGGLRVHGVHRESSGGGGRSVILDGKLHFFKVKLIYNII